MYNCYVIDDEKHAIETLTGYINRLPGLHLLGANTNPLEAINDINNGTSPDIVFLDVDMPELSGMDVADMLSPKSAIVFTTAFPNYAVEAFEKNGSDFILKPISFDRFAKSVNKVQNKIKVQRQSEQTIQDEYFFINPGIKGKMIQLNFSDILYIEGLKNYVIIYTADDKFITYLSMREVEKSIPESKFIRIHKSFIVNIEKIKEIDGNNVVLSPTLELPLGISFKDGFFEVINMKTLRSNRKG